MHIHRMRRLRMKPGLRTMVRETQVLRRDLIYPLFVCSGSGVRTPLASIPGAFLLSGDELVLEAKRLWDLGITAVLLFPVIEPGRKDALASASFAKDSPVMQALRVLSRSVPELVLIVDLCLCEYTSHGHCGLVKGSAIDNDTTLQVLARAGVALAEAGAGLLAPSGMMDGTVATLRTALDDAGHPDVALMPYSAKFQSLLYGPFKTATSSSPGESKHATHQLDVGNGREALRKIRQDVDEGADCVIVKPAATSLDILATARLECSVPLAAYDVSGSYRMVLDYCGDDEGMRQTLMLEMLVAIKRAGADMIITYFAPAAARVLT